MTPPEPRHGTVIHRKDAPLKAILLMVVAVGIWALHDAAAKWYAALYPIFVILFWRSLFGLVPVLLLARRMGGIQRLPRRTVALCLLRGSLGFCSFTSFVFALPTMPLADAIAVGMAAPIFLTAASALFLREPVGIHRWGAVLVGFAAVIFIVRPGGQIPPDGAALLIASNLFYTVSMMLTRKLGRTVSTATLSLYTGLAFSVFGALGVAFVWVMPSPTDLAIFVVIGFMAGLAQLAMTAAFRIASPAVVAPFEYTGVVWGVLLGLLFWNEWPSRDVVIGVAVIIASGLYIVHRERVRHLRDAAAP